jgi:hypothetical protein
MSNRFLILSIYILAAGCAGFPTLHPYAIDYANNQCIPCTEVGTENVCQQDFVCDSTKAVPLSQCTGFTAVPASDVVALKKYQAEQCSSEKIKK